MAEGTGEFNYDELLTLVEKAYNSGYDPCWVQARSVREAEAFACWCIENGIEEPEIMVRG